MNSIRGLSLGVVLLSLVGLAEAGGGKKAQELLVGKWMGEAKDTEIVSITMEFAKDGKYKVETKTGDVRELVKGTYKLVDDKTLELAPAIEGEKPSRLKIEKLTEDMLILIAPEIKQRFELKRVK
jgi:uncharacterized protein (TIGR03066 family)